MTTLILLILGTPIASASDPVEDAKPTVVAISLMSLPIIGLIVLLIVTLPAMAGRPYRVEPPGLHVANILTVVALLTFIDALMAPYVLSRGVDPTLSFAVVGVLDMLIVTGVFSRYLLFPVNWATAVGAALAIITVVSMYSMYQMPLATLYLVEDVLGLALPVLAILFIGLLTMETVRYHLMPGGDHREPDWPRVPPRRRMLRLGEVLIMTFVVAVAMALVWS
jgi:hypothetical protein